MIDLRSTVEHFASTYTVRRPGATTYVNGLPQQGAPTSRTITALVRPASPHDLQRLPEGDRSEPSVRIYTVDEIATVNQPGARAADILEYQGRDWEIRDVRVHDTQGLFFDAIATRQGQ